jgi:hypothetical protein
VISSAVRSDTESKSLPFTISSLEWERRCQEK